MKAWLRRVVRPAGAGVLLGILALLGIASLSAHGQSYVHGTDPQFPRVLQPDSLTTLNDRCIVRQMRLTPSIRPVYVNFHPVGFCWTTCVSVFVKDPDPYLEIQKIAPQCAVFPDKPAIVDSLHREFVNFEVFYFSSQAARKKFKKNPLQYSGWLTDPVSGVRFRASKRSPKLSHGTRLYYFTSDSTRKTFAEVPDRFAFRRGK